MLRTPRGALVAALVLLGLALFFALHPMFGTAPPTTLEGLLTQHPLALSGFSGAVKSSLDEDQRFKVRDHWGLTYPASQKIDVAGFSGGLRRKVVGLNEALGYLAEGDLVMAKVKLEESYGDSLNGVDRGTIQNGPFPNQNQDELALYGLYRYNRALNYFQLTKNLRSGNSKTLKHHRRGLHDLRRAIAAFETLGSKQTFLKPYWGSSKAWQGVRLHKTGHGGLPIHYVYANLSTAYLRLSNSRGYPYVDKSYMQGEHDKYQDSGSQLSGVVSSLTQSCIKSRCAPAKYRLTMALQNLEAASRGMNNKSESKFNYMIGLTLCHLYRYDTSLGFGDAIPFLEMAVDTGKDPGRAPVLAAKKELALIYLELDQETEMREQLLDLEPAPFRDLAQGPERHNGLLFTDMALYGYFARGRLERVYDHLQIRRGQFKTERIDDKIIADQAALLGTEGDVFFSSLERRFDEMIAQGRIAEVSNFLHTLDGDSSLRADPILFQSYISRCREPLAGRKQVAVSLIQTQTAWLKLLTNALPGLFVFLTIALLTRFYLSQRRIALGMLKSSYADDLGTT